MVKTLSEKQRRIIEFLRSYIADKEYPPSIREIQASCEISSTSVVAYNLGLLEKAGFFRREREVSRGITLLEPAARRARAVAVPIIGAIAAGSPIPVPDEGTWSTAAEETLDLPPAVVGNRDGLYALRVRGNSMIDSLINDGDIVVMEVASTADDGDMVAAWLKAEQETTLKKLYREPGRIRLQPANSAVAPIFAAPNNVDVQGKVVAVIRRVG